MNININQDQLRANLLSTAFWVRMFFMVIFALVLWAMTAALIIMCVVQTIVVLITGEVNDQLKKLGAIATDYLSQVVAFMLFVTEDKPFPFSPLPGEQAPSAAAVQTGTGVATTADKQDVPVLSESDDDDDDSFYDPSRDSGATR